MLSSWRNKGHEILVVGGPSTSLNGDVTSLECI